MLDMSSNEPAPPRVGASTLVRDGSSVLLWRVDPRRAMAAKAAFWGLAAGTVAAALVLFASRVMWDLHTQVQVGRITVLALLAVTVLLGPVVVGLAPIPGPTSLMDADPKRLLVVAGRKVYCLEWGRIAGLSVNRSRLCILACDGERVWLNLTGYSWRAQREFTRAVRQRARLPIEDGVPGSRLYHDAQFEFKRCGPLTEQYRLLNPHERRGAPAEMSVHPTPGDSRSILR